MKNAKVPILGFAAHSGTGKTTLLTQLIPTLKQDGLRIGLIKHSHHNFQIDQPGKDSFRLREAGASAVMLVSSHRRAIITEFSTITEPLLNEQLLAFDQSELDLILVEGFKATQFPKIELHRPSHNMSLLYPNDPSIIAVASDIPLSIPSTLVQLDLNQPGQIAQFITQQFMGLT
ncbi:molybdopterin-guanine dinucleotide biosynthesis adapter protein MobB [Methyloglobulus morosus KoM1]|uniref:Molybdopterin-guanine dinucleotide biosynthesis adapter protein MobB n=1 Tax=Methyloglobulus morosus KoM1 TaxID=1116472 RepID=V5BXL2_9GAMM|nr:molybdopterin-guanine dinucleotide biosynthesis protein B [Methyloglobulus morosus]ESS72559.1 molybdopterin-guanine dinucleotide biosynthesis adapter protein MobB [Methyloglobulus morosus KoM1]